MNINTPPHTHTPTHIRTRRTDQQKTAISVCLLQTENGNGKLHFVCCKRKRITEVCFPWWANDKRNRRMPFQQKCPSMNDIHV